MDRVKVEKEQCQLQNREMSSTAKGLIDARHLDGARGGLDRGGIASEGMRVSNRPAHLAQRIAPWPAD